MGAYTDPTLLDERAAVEALPRLDLKGGQSKAKKMEPTSAVDGAETPDDTPFTLNDRWRDFLVFFLVSNLGEGGTSISNSLTPPDTGRDGDSQVTSTVKTAGAATYDRSRHPVAASAAAYPQGDSNPCLQDENLIS